MTNVRNISTSIQYAHQLQQTNLRPRGHGTDLRRRTGVVRRRTRNPRADRPSRRSRLGLLGLACACLLAGCAATQQDVATSPREAIAQSVLAIKALALVVGEQVKLGSLAPDDAETMRQLLQRALDNAATANTLADRPASDPELSLSLALLRSTIATSRKYLLDKGVTP